MKVERRPPAGLVDRVGWADQILVRRGGRACGARERNVGWPRSQVDLPGDPFDDGRGGPRGGLGPYAPERNAVVGLGVGDLVPSVSPLERPAPDGQLDPRAVPEHPALHPEPDAALHPERRPALHPAALDVEGAAVPGATGVEAAAGPRPVPPWEHLSGPVELSSMEVRSFVRADEGPGWAVFPDAGQPEESGVGSVAPVAPVASVTPETGSRTAGRPTARRAPGPRGPHPDPVGQAEPAEQAERAAQAGRAAQATPSSSRDSAAGREVPSGGRRPGTSPPATAGADGTEQESRRGDTTTAAAGPPQPADAWPDATVTVDLPRLVDAVVESLRDREAFDRTRRGGVPWQH